MGREIILFKSEERKTSGEVAAVLREIADKLEQRQMTLKQAANEITLDFPENLVLELKVEEEEEEGRKVKRSLEIELEWVPGEESSGRTSIL